MYTLQELCLDCTGANASNYQVCEIEGMCCEYYLSVIWIVRSTYDSDFKRAEISLRNIVS